MLDGEAMAAEVVKTVREYVAKATAPLLAQIAEQAAQIKALQHEPILPDVERIVAEQIAQLPKPKDAEPVDYKRMAELIDGTVAARIKIITMPKDGKDADPEAVRAIVAEESAKAVAALAKPKDGEKGEPGKDGAPGRDAEPVHPDTVSLMVAQEVTRALALLPKAKDGDPGRDALAPDILDGLDESRAYPRGTFAGHRGAFVKALRLTDPLAGKSLRDAGWQIIVDGDRDTEIVQESDLRTFAFRKTKASGLVIESKTVLPIMIYRGVWKPGTFEPGDVTTWDGSAWHCERTTKAEPGNGGDWKLMVKRGATGKDHNGAARN